MAPSIVFLVATSAAIWRLMPAGLKSSMWSP
jgi:hypothetical protein